MKWLWLLVVYYPMGVFSSMKAIQYWKDVEIFDLVFSAVALWPIGPLIWLYEWAARLNVIFMHKL